MHPLQQALDELEGMLSKPLSDAALDRAQQLYQELLQLLPQYPAQFDPLQFSTITTKFTFQALAYSLEQSGDTEQAAQVRGMSLDWIDRILEASRQYAAGQFQQAIETLQLARQAIGRFQARMQEIFGPETAGAFDLLAAQNQQHLALMYQRLGDYQTALGLLEQAVQVYTKQGETSRPDYAKALGYLGAIYFEIGSVDLARSYNEQAYSAMRSLVESIYQPQQVEQILMMDSEVAVLRNNLAMIHAYQGRFDQALKMLLELAGQYEAAQQLNLDYARVCNNLAVVLYQMGEYDHAGTALGAALEVYSQMELDEHPDAVAALANAADLLRRRGEYQQALQYAIQAFQMEVKLLGERHPNVANRLLSAARAAVGLDMQEDALTMLQAAQEVMDAVMSHVFGMASESQRLNFAQQARYAFVTHLSFLAQKLSRSGKADGTADGTVDGTADGKADGTDNPWSGADLEAVQDSYNLVLRRKGLTAEVSAMQRAAVLGGRYPHLAPQFQEWIRLREQIAQLALAGPGMDSLGTHQALLQTLEAQREKLESTLARQAPELSLERVWQVASLEVVADALPAESILVDYVRCEMYNFKARFGDGQPEWLPAHTLAYILRAGEPDSLRLVDLGEANHIDDLVTAWRSALTGETIAATSSVQPGSSAGSQKDDKIPAAQERRSAWEGARHLGRARQPRQRNGREEGIALRKAIFDPLLEILGAHPTRQPGSVQGDLNRLFIVPDGGLAQVSFAALPLDPKPGEPDAQPSYLIDHFQVSYLGSGRDLLRSQFAISGEPGAPLILAAPDYDLGGAGLLGFQPGVPFPALVGTQAEGEELAKLLQIPVYSGAAANERQIKQATSPLVLHIATHGFFLEESEEQLQVYSSPLGGLRIANLSHLESPLLRSGLALAGANTWAQGGSLQGAEDGILNAEDVAGLDLLNTELVVLSACETGLGKVEAGEGVLGLRRAFQIAGARTLVMSLWRVPDRQTQELMVDFYQRILQSTPRAAALHQAQLELRSKYPQRPDLWGAFILQGAGG